MRRVIITIVVAIAVGGCAGQPGGPSPVRPSVSQSPTGAAGVGESAPPLDPDPLDPRLTFLRYGCDGHPFGLDLFAVPGRAELEDHPSAEALRTFLAGGEAADLVPIGGWHLAGRDAESASYVAQVAGDPPFASIGASLRDGTWTVEDYGQCRPMVAMEGLNAATFRFVGDAPGPDATRLELDVTEIACAGGRPMGTRLRPATVIETEGFVGLLFTAVTQAGGQDCQGNPATRVTVELGAPVGERRVLDLAVFPFHDPATDWPS
ncbi:MAG TPA: hypothetical protein VH720_14930 [Candidatus Limnocylindrales bacterium]